MPRSEAFLRRLYRDGFVPVEKKSVVDMRRTRGVFLRSSDANPMIINDAASQIASLGTGFNADSYLRALDDGALDAAIIANADLTVPFADEDTSGPIAEQRRGAEAYANFLLAHAHNDIKYVLSKWWC